MEVELLSGVGSPLERGPGEPYALISLSTVETLRISNDIAGPFDLAFRALVRALIKRLDLVWVEVTFNRHNSREWIRFCPDGRRLQRVDAADKNGREILWLDTNQISWVAVLDQVEQLSWTEHRKAGV